MSIVIVIVLFVITLFVAICLHELGHFIAAKRAGVKVEELGIGLPPRLFGIRRRETLYSVNAIPIGAFVRTAGEHDASVPRGLAGKGPWTRLGIYVSGPLVNIFLAFVFFTAFAALPYSVVAGNGVMVHSVVENSPADGVGIRPGDIILEIEKHRVRKWGEVQAIVNSVKEGEEITLVVKRDGRYKEIRLTPRTDPQSQRRIIGVVLCWNIVTEVEEGSLAYQAGVRVGDTVLSIGGWPVYSNNSMSHALRSIPKGAKVKLVLLRGRETIRVSLPSDSYTTLPGVALRWVDAVRIEQERLPLWRAAYEGASFIVLMPSLIIKAIGVMREAPDAALVGPIGAGHLTVEIVHSYGLGNMLFMGSIISLGIAIFNLLPIPPLDGGGMLVAFIEGCRRGKRLSPRAVRLAYTVGTAFLIALVVLVTFRDILRLITGRGFGS